MDLFSTIDSLKAPNFTCASGMWEEFRQGNLWADFQKELQCWLADTWANLETETDPEEMAQLRGRARTIREVLLLPDNVIQMIQRNQEEE